MKNQAIQQAQTRSQSTIKSLDEQHEFDSSIQHKFASSVSVLYLLKYTEAANGGVL